MPFPSKLQSEVMIVADEPTERNPIKDFRQEEGAHELLKSP
jgi:hypothetical protein